MAHNLIWTNGTITIGDLKFNSNPCKCHLDIKNVECAGNIRQQPLGSTPTTKTSQSNMDRMWRECAFMLKLISNITRGHSIANSKKDTNYLYYNAGYITLLADKDNTDVDNNVLAFDSSTNISKRPYHASSGSSSGENQLVNVFMIFNYDIEEGGTTSAKVTKSGNTLTLEVVDGDNKWLDNFDLTDEIRRTLGDLVDYINTNRRSKGWYITLVESVEDTSGYISADIDDFEETECYGATGDPSEPTNPFFATMTITYRLNIRVQVGDLLKIVDATSPLNGRQFTVGNAIDYVNNTLSVIGGLPSEEAIFGEEDNMTFHMIRFLDEFPYYPEIQHLIWKRQYPDLLTDDYLAAICKHDKYTSYNVQYTGTGEDDRVYKDDFDYSHCRECTYTDSSNQVPVDQRNIYASYRNEVGGYRGLGDGQAQVKGCGGNGGTCAGYEKQAISDVGDINWYANMLEGEYCVMRQLVVGFAYYEVIRRSGVSIADLLGTYPDNNSNLDSRRYILHTYTGSTGHQAHSGGATDNGWYTKAHRLSNDSDNAAEDGFLKTHLGNSRPDRRYGVAISSIDTGGATSTTQHKAEKESDFLNPISSYERHYV